MNDTPPAEDDRVRAERLLSALVASRRECAGLRADLAAKDGIIAELRADWRSAELMAVERDTRHDAEPVAK